MKLVGPVLACTAFAAGAPLSAPPLRIYDIWYEGCEATGPGHAGRSGLDLRHQPSG